MKMTQPEEQYTRANVRPSKTRFSEKRKKPTPMRERLSLWKFTYLFFTFIIPNWLLSWFGMRQNSVRNAWREKFTLCILIMNACLVLAFITYGMNSVVCRGDNKYIYSKLYRTDFHDESLIARGAVYRIEPDHEYFNVLVQLKGLNCTGLFPNKDSTCKSRFGGPVCKNRMNETELSLKDDRNMIRVSTVNYTWADVNDLGFIVIENKVYDANLCTEEFYFNFIEKNKGDDGTIDAKNWSVDELECFKNTFYAGDIMVKTYGCILADLMLYVSTIAIFGLIIVRFFLAIGYSWMMKSRSRRLMKDPKNPCTMACILLVTCYSEDEHGIRNTLDSLCCQKYNEQYKLIVIIADGNVRGTLNTYTTPEILLNIITVDDKYPITPKQYIALGSGEKRYNEAKVYPGSYENNGYTTKLLLIVKTGNSGEIGKPKAGNRGKRDSQVILMSFFERLLYDFRMYELDYDIYIKMKYILPNINPYHYESILMVDADTIVKEDALEHMVRVLENDKMIMGLCGETKISNKTESWVTMIQVFEYYISHHLCKAFESVFGGVTCLPGCFCMYRIQSFQVICDEIKTMPIVAHPLILNEYSVFETNSLHKKNLLLLGEDRYLTTLLLKTFSYRKLVFVPAAISMTLVPSDFSVLLSQRRRWINSTIHNLFELILVNKLCGTFCFSMQFVVLMELMGTLVLPAAILFTFVLLAVSILVEPAWIPLIMLFGILGLPAILIALTTLELGYLIWILIYIISLPIWNFILPLYAFWHFDDFSWGETRKIEGVADHENDEGHSYNNYSVYKLMFLNEYIKRDPIDYANK